MFKGVPVVVVGNENPLILVEIAGWDVESDDAIIVRFVGEIDVVDGTRAGLESETSERRIEAWGNVGDSVILDDAVEIFSVGTIEKKVDVEESLLDGFDNELLALTAGDIGTLISLGVTRADIVESGGTIHGL